MRALYNALRSRKLAFWLIGAFTLYATVAVIVTDGDYAAAYASPLFAAISLALMLATGACAWERSARAVHLSRLGTGVTPDFVKRLESSPQIAVPLSEDSDPDAVLAEVGRRLLATRLRVKVGDRRLSAGSSRLSMVGSPIFHWALALLFLTVGGGRLVRAEGLMGVPLGSSRPDTAASYGVLSEGLLHSSAFSGLEVAVTDLDLDLELDGISRGSAPTVALLDGETTVAEGIVYPNHPLRYRSLLIHSSAYGLTARFTLEGVEIAEGAEAGRDIFYDFSSVGPVAEEAAPLVLTSEGSELTINTRVPLDVQGETADWVLPAEPRVEWTLADGSAHTSGTVEPGGSIELPSGGTLTLEDVTYYIRLSVVDDPSIYPIYLLLALATVGLAMALLLPPRVVWVMVVERDGARALHARTRQGRGDRVFPSDVEDMLAAAAGGDRT